MQSIRFATSLPLVVLAVLVAPTLAGATTRIACIGLHGGVQEVLARHAAVLDTTVVTIPDASLGLDGTDLSEYDVVLLEHVRAESARDYDRLFRAARLVNPDVHVVSIASFAAQRLPDLVRDGVIEEDAAAEPYYGNSDENLRRFLKYVLRRYAGRDLDVEPPEEVDHRGLYHPDHDGLFPDVPSFLRFARERGLAVDDAPRAVVAVHLTHLMLQQPKVVDALIRELEGRGVLAVAVVDQVAAYEEQTLEFAPQVVIHTCHSRDAVSYRERLDVPHLHSVFFRAQSIDEWRTSDRGLAANELNLHLTSQEVVGGIEPIAAAGTIEGGGSGESFTPIPERVAHLIDRACGWIRLARAPAAEKKVAILYWDREMGKSELMRGSATGMHLNGPRSLVKVLDRLADADYTVSPRPQDEDELIAWMMDRGRQIGVWAPGVLDRLARSGAAALVPTATYRGWLEERVPKALRDDLVARWGEPPGRFLVWRNDVGEEFIVIPRIDLGHVVLLPQPLRGEAHDTSLLHDRAVPPPHNYLCTYFWLEEEFDADALIHFGTHGSEIALPGKDNGLSDHDWCDVVIGRTPNLYPWIQNNLGESSVARRRTYAVLIDHLVPPSVAAGLSDELANLHGDIDKWESLDDGALRDRFRDAITRRCRAERLDQDLRFDLEDDRALTDSEIEALRDHLHEIAEETTPISLHVLGEAPAPELRLPYLVTCLGSRFLDALAEIIPVPATDARNDGDRTSFLRTRAEEAVRLAVAGDLDAEDALVVVGARLPESGLSEELAEGFERAHRIDAGLRAAPREIDALLAALDGRFVPPGPGSTPDRNPASVPTGKDLYVMNPEEVPTRPSYEVGRALAEQLLADRKARTGAYPERVAFTLSPFTTFQDYGVMESEILHLLGVRPVWDARNLVTGVELVPAAELGRPRVDVFLALGGYYRDLLPTRMRLLDEAVRLVAEQDEPENRVRSHTARVEAQLAEGGMPAERARMLARARLFGPPPGEIGSASYYYLVERSGEWSTREELVGLYIEHSQYAYTEGSWGEDAPQAYREQVQGTEVVVRNWSDRTRSPLSNKYFWYRGGSLSLAIEHLTGREPQFFLADVRDPDRARMVDAEDALRTDYRVRLFNRKWIEGMMKEGYAGADQIAVCVTNSMGWKIMRQGSVTDDVWEEIVDTYVRDEKSLGIREWFEAENPFAFQEVTETLLEVVRKGYWKPGEATLREIATAYARSIARHGEDGGLRGGGNAALDAFVRRTLAAPRDPELDALAAAIHARARESAAPAETRTATAKAKEPPAESEARPAPPVEIVAGRVLEEVEPPARSGPRRAALAAAAAVLLLVALGLWRRAGAPS